MIVIGKQFKIIIAIPAYPFQYICRYIMYSGIFCHNKGGRKGGICMKNSWEEIESMPTFENIEEEIAKAESDLQKAVRQIRLGHTLLF